VGVFFIAEAANNHGGCVKKALTMVQIAAECGADAIKFQVLDPEEFCGDGYKLKEDFEQLALTPDEFRTLRYECHKMHIEFMATPFSIRAVDWLEEIGVLRYKIGSGDLTYDPLLKKVASTERPVILSTGMGTVDEVKAAIKALRSSGCGHITLLKCTVDYPCEDEDVNLAGMVTLRHSGWDVGLSDHTENGVASILAVAMGASVIEKHFYLDKNPNDGSSCPADLADLIVKIRQAEVMVGSAELGMSECEEKWKALARRNPTTGRRE